MKPKQQLQIHQSNTQLKIQVFLMLYSIGPLKCWKLLSHRRRLDLQQRHYETIRCDIVNSHLCRAQPLNVHVKCRDGGLHHCLGIKYQTLIQMLLSSITGRTYVCGFS